MDSAACASITLISAALGSSSSSRACAGVVFGGGGGISDRCPHAAAHGPAALLKVLSPTRAGPVALKSGTHHSAGRCAMNRCRMLAHVRTISERSDESVRTADPHPSCETLCGMGLFLKAEARKVKEGIPL